MPFTAAGRTSFPRKQALVLLPLLLLPAFVDAQSLPPSSAKAEKRSRKHAFPLGPRVAPKAFALSAHPEVRLNRARPIPEATHNYSFVTTTTGSLTEMSSGTTALVGSDQDDVSSDIAPIGFDFYFQGVRQTNFSVSSNGSLTFGGYSDSAFHPLARVGAPVLAPYGSDQRTHAGDGKIHYKVIGTAPTRVLVVEWLNQQSEYTGGGTADLTYQVRLSESTGEIEFVYGAMKLTAGAVADPNANTPQIGFSSTNTAGNVGYVIAPQSGTPAPTFEGTSDTPLGNPYTEGPIQVLNSAANGSRRTFKFSPPVPTAPGGPLTFTSVTQSGMTLNWTDSPNELSYAIYRSTDNVNFTLVNEPVADSTSYAATGLLAGTNYFWRVHAVSEGALGTLSGSQSTVVPPPNVSVATGNWNAAATWSAGVPTNGQNVTVSTGHTVTLNSAGAAYSLAVAGTLQFEQNTARTLTVTRDVTVQSGGTFRSNNGGTQTNHNLNVGGSLTNNGTLDFSTNGNAAGARITFIGGSNETFSGTGGTTDLRTLTVNKGVDRTSLLEVTPTNFTVRGVTTNSAAWLTLTAGTIRLGGTFTGNNRVFAPASGAYFIPTSAGFWLDNPNYTVTAQNAVVVNDGHLRISQGTFNAGTAADSGIATQVHGSIFTIEGGTVNCAGIFGPGGRVIYRQSGGTLNVATVGNTVQFLGAFDIYDPGATFDMTGGSIVIHRQPGVDSLGYVNLATILSASGTLQVGSATSQAGATFDLSGTVPNLVVDGTSTAKVARIAPDSVDLPDSRLFIRGSTTIQAGSTLNLNGQVCAIFGSSFTNHGILNGTAAGSWLAFDSTGPVATYQGTGTVTAPLAKFEVYNSVGLTIDPAVNQIVALEFDLSAGRLTGANKLTLGNGGDTSAVLQIGAAGGGRPVLGLDATPTFNPGTGGISLIYEEEASPRTTGAEVPSDRTVDVLVIRNPTAVSGGDLHVGYLLDLTNYRLTTGTHAIALAPGASVIRGFGFVHGNLRKIIPGAGSGTVSFEVGSDDGYGPVDFQVSAGTFPATVTVSTTQGIPDFALPFTYPLGRGWQISCDTSLTANLTFNYQPAEVIFSTDSYLFLKLQGGVYSTFPPSSPPTDSAASLSNAVISGASQWAVVEPTWPNFLNLDNTTFVVGANNSFTFTVVGAPIPTLALDGKSDPLPDGVTFQAATGELSGTPADGTQGAFRLVVTASNGTNDTQQEFWLYVSDTANQPPIPGTDVLGTRQGQAAAVPAARLLVNDRDPEGDTLSITGVSSTSAQGGTVTICGCFETVTYYPPPAFSGPDSFTYTVSDGRGGTAIGTVNVTIVPSSAGTQNVLGLTMPGGVPTLTAYGIPGRTYRLEYTDDMGGAWTTLTSQIAAPNGALILTDPSPVLPPNRFYRVVEDL